MKVGVAKMNKILDYLEEILIAIAIISFSMSGFFYGVAIGLQTTALSTAIGSFIVMKYKKNIAGRR